MNVLITGAAKRIGRSIALRLASEGVKVAIHYSTSEAEARQTAKECGDAPIFKANLESVAEIQRMFAEVGERFGKLDGLVNNAARFTRFDPMNITEADWDFIHSVNLKSVFFCCQSGAKLMSDGGRIVNISSLGGLRPWADHAHYCASKAGVIMLTKALAKALGAEDYRQQCRAWGDPVWEARLGAGSHDRGDTGGTGWNGRRDRRRGQLLLTCAGIHYRADSRCGRRLEPPVTVWSESVSCKPRSGTV